MPAVSSTIFKIRAHSDFIAKSCDSGDILSFRKGQPFYALSADYEKGFYFVSTQYAVPFSRTAVSGLVPIEYFEKVMLLLIGGVFYTITYHISFAYMLNIFTLNIFRNL